MTKKDTENAFTDVAGLMAERQQYEAWLAALDARRDATPRHVFQRVRSDYETRLKQVLELLSSHRSELEERLVTLTKRVATLETEEQAKRDEREELELRSAVGELSPEGYEKQAAELDRQVAEVSAQRASVREEADRTREFLDAAVRPSPAIQQEAVSEKSSGKPAPAAETTASEASASKEAGAKSAASTGTPAASSPAAKPTPAAPPAGRGPGFDELAFLNAVVEGSDELPPQRVSTERPAVAEPEPSKPAPARAESPRVPRPARPAPRLSAPRRSSKPDWIAKEPSETLDTLTPDSDADAVEKQAESPLAANISGNHPIVLRSSGQVEHSKTLKCAECGTMNYPTEWYCERCGAELAAL